jgi:hypothetical protein
LFLVHPGGNLLYIMDKKEEYFIHSRLIYWQTD